MKETVNKWFKVFGVKLWEWNITTTTTPEYIETNVTDDVVAELQKRTKRDKDIIDLNRKEYKAERRLA